MKKLVLALAVIAAIATTANAGKVQVQKELGWTVSNSSVANGTRRVVFTARPLDSEAIDTTGVFSLMDASPAGPGSFSGDIAAADSILLGYVVVYTDSTADGASTLTALTGTIDASGDGNDWATATTVSGILASDDPIVVLPIVQRPTLDHQNLVWMAPKLRIRFTTATGILLAARAKLVYWKEDKGN